MTLEGTAARQSSRSSAVSALQVQHGGSAVGYAGVSYFSDAAEGD